MSKTRILVLGLAIGSAVLAAYLAQGFLGGQKTATEVVEVNTALKSKPETVNSDPHGSWMIVLKFSNPGEAASLLDAAQYADLVK